MIDIFRQTLLARRGAQLSLAVLIGLVLLSALAPLIAPQNPGDPLAFDPTAANHAPTLSWTYLLGADGRGRSVLALALWGGRLSLPIGIGSALLAGLLGLGIGTVAAMAGELTGSTLGRLLDVVEAAPPLVLALMVFSRFGGLHASALILIFAATGWATPARIALSSAAAAMESLSVEAARAVGVSGWRLMRMHILPGALSGTLVWVAGAAARYTALECGLDFLNLGLNPDVVSWGTALAGAQDALAQGNWWWLAAGGALPAVTAVSLNHLAAALARALDPVLFLATLPYRRAAATMTEDGQGSADALDEQSMPRAGLTDPSDGAPAGAESGAYRRGSFGSFSYRASAPPEQRRGFRRALFVLTLGVAVAAIAGGALQQYTRRPQPDAAAIVARASAYLARSDTPAYIATVTFDADLAPLRHVQIPWAARRPCPAALHALECAHADAQVWFSQGHGRTLTDGGAFVCGPGRTWSVNPMAGMALTTNAGCTVLGADLRGLGFTAGQIQSLLPAPTVQGATVIGQDLMAGRRCWVVSLKPSGSACVDTRTGLVLRLDLRDRAGLPVARFAITAVDFNLALDPELFANPIPGGHGPLIDGLSQPLLNIQAADDQALFTTLVPTFIPPGLSAQTPTFDSFYNSARGYALEQRVRQAYQDNRGRVALVIIEMLPGSSWDSPPPGRAEMVPIADVRLQVWPSSSGAPSVVRVERIGTAAQVRSAVLPLSVLERVAVGLQ